MLIGSNRKFQEVNCEKLSAINIEHINKMSSISSSRIGLPYYHV